MWNESRKARWSLFSLWTGLAVILVLASGIRSTDAEGIEFVESRDQQTPCAVETAELVQVASLKSDAPAAGGMTD